MRHKAHFCAYELLASRLSSLLDVSQCDKKRSNTLLTVSALGLLKPISFRVVQDIASMIGQNHLRPGTYMRRRPLKSPLRNANSCHVGYL